MALTDEPMPISGPKSVPESRKVLWKNVCLIGVITHQSTIESHVQNKLFPFDNNNQRECIVEMSRTKTKFYIVAIDLEYFKYHVVELFRPQANKLLKACNNSMHRLMTFLEFKFGTLCIKDMDILMQY